MTQQAQAEVMKPCPFCDHQPDESRIDYESEASLCFSVHCENCGAKGPRGDGPSEALKFSAAREWNRRAQLVPPLVVTEEMHVAAVKVLNRASGLDGLPQRMLDAMLAVEPVSEGCRHRIADIRNPLVKSGYMCIDCGVLFSAADHDGVCPPAQERKPVSDEDCDKLIAALCPDFCDQRFPGDRPIMRQLVRGALPHGVGVTNAD